MNIGISVVNIDLVLTKLGTKARESNYLIKFIKEFVCYNQGKYAQYSFIAVEKHKKLMQEIYVDSPDENKVKEEYQKLMDHLDRELENIFLVNFSYLSEYFSFRTKKCLPRICVKTFHDGNISDMFREDWSYVGVVTPVESNTGFQHVHVTGESFFCNNLPTLAKKSGYKNPRLDDTKVRSYNSWVISSLLSRLMRGMHDQHWINCWLEVPGANGKPYRPGLYSCYKSTFIVPITLLRNLELDYEFRDMFGISEGPERAIYGFLCFDHPDLNFFNEDADIKVGYIFADILSLYMICRLRMTLYSDAVLKAKSIIS